MTWGMKRSGSLPQVFGPDGRVISDDAPSGSRTPSSPAPSSSNRVPATTTVQKPRSKYRGRLSLNSPHYGSPYMGTIRKSSKSGHKADIVSDLRDDYVAFSEEYHDNEDRQRGLISSAAKLSVVPSSSMARPNGQLPVYGCLPVVAEERRTSAAQPVVTPLIVRRATVSSSNAGPVCFLAAAAAANTIRERRNDDEPSGRPPAIRMRQEISDLLKHFLNEHGLRPPTFLWPNMQKRMLDNSCAADEVSASNSLNAAAAEDEDASQTMEMPRRHGFGDLLWLTLQAYMAGRPMRPEQLELQSNVQQDREICRRRQELKGVIEELAHFQLPDTPIIETKNPELVVFKADYRRTVYDARAKVEEILQRLDEFENLFPRLAALKIYCELEHLPLEEALTRARFLTVWRNTHADLMAQINQIGRHYHGHLTKQFAAASSPPIHAPDVAWPFEAGSTMDLDEKAARKHLHDVYDSLVAQSRVKGLRKALGKLRDTTAASCAKAATLLAVKPSYAQVMGPQREPLLNEQQEQRWGAELRATSLVDPFVRQELRLPSLAPYLHFVIRISFDLTAQWLCSRAGEDANCPVAGGDSMTLHTILEDCRDCLEEAVVVKRDYLHIATAISPGCAGSEENPALTEYDRGFSGVFENYLFYVRRLTQLFVAETTIDNHFLRMLHEKMLSEWSVAVKLATRSVAQPYTKIANTFCAVGIDLSRQLVLEYLEKELEELDMATSSWDVPTDGTTSLDFDGVRSRLSNISSGSDSGVMRKASEGDDPSSYTLFACRRIARLQRSLEGRIRAVAQVVGHVIKGLVNAIRLQFPTEDPEKLRVVLTRLAELGFVKLNVLALRDLLILVDSSSSRISGRPAELLSSLAGGAPFSDQDDDQAPTLVLVPLNTPCAQALWTGPSSLVELSSTVFDELRYLKRDDIYVVSEPRQFFRAFMQFDVKDDDADAKNSKETLVAKIVKTMRHNGLIVRGGMRPVTCHELISERVDELRTIALEILSEVWEKFAKRFWADLGANESVLRQMTPNERGSVRSTLRRAFIFSFQLHMVFARVIPIDNAAEFARLSLDMLRHWLEYLRVFGAARHKIPVIPIWAQPAFHFMQSIVDPRISQHIADQDVMELASLIKECGRITLGLDEEGGNESPGTPPVTVSLKTNKTSSSSGGPKSPYSSLSPPVAPRFSISPTRSPTSSRPITPTKLSPFFPPANARKPLTASQGPVDMLSRRREAIERLEKEREAKLADQFGQVVVPPPPPQQQQQQQKHPLLPKIGTEQVLRRLFDDHAKPPFKWQRLEKKLGRGRFGVVYVALNVDEQRLVAVKQVKLEQGERAAAHVQALAAEVEQLRSLKHPRLVTYYGAELHNGELMILMELCHGGSLDRIIRGEGLAMPLVREYTRDLLEAIAYIHRHHVVHRDVKPANIFVTENNRLKLGDFGASLRLRQQHTVFGEVVDFVGTPRYMAPEVHQNQDDPDEDPDYDYAHSVDMRPNPSKRSDSGVGSPSVLHTIKGYGRAVDIWSSGCVVLEMATGKRPFAEIEEEMQVVFRVGMGARPACSLPDPMLNEFLALCFAVKPKDRATAEELLRHAFANIVTTHLEE